MELPQKNRLQEILSNIHLDYVDENNLSELIYTASECGLISGVELEEIETIAKIFKLASMYDDIPEKLRM